MSHKKEQGDTKGEYEHKQSIVSVHDDKEEA